MIAILGILLLALIYMPNLMVKYTLRKYANDLPGIPGTGAELARHLITRFELSGVQVEETEPGADHYDPNKNCVRLSPNNYHGRSLTAVAVAAHEVGHAIQFNRNETISRLRGQYMPKAATLRRVGITIMGFMPLIGLLIHVPQAMILVVLIGIVTMMAGAAMYLIILPEEWDASFNKAFPILKEGNYIQADQERAVQQILRAAAFTYLAGALADILSIWRWIAILKR
jgi:Zn-dependent membrane protease YugP